MWSVATEHKDRQASFAAALKRQLPGAVITVSHQGHQCDDITVVGVDGTDEALAVIRSGGSPFRATVVQNSQRTADVAVRQLLKLRAGERVEAETFVPTTIYPLEME